MNEDVLRTDELAALLGFAPMDQPASDPAAVDRRPLPPRASEERGPREPPDTWHSIGRGESLEDLPFSADIRFTLLSICEEFTDRLQLRLTELLRLNTSVQGERIVADTFAALILGMPQPTCLAVATLAPLDSRLLVEIPCGTAFPLLERLLGGQPRSPSIAARPLTDLELRVFGHVLDTVLHTWSTSWQSMVNIHAVLERVESNPRVVRCLPAVTPILVIPLSVGIGDMSLPFRLALPVRTAVESCGGGPQDGRNSESPQGASPAEVRRQVSEVLAATLRAVDAAEPTVESSAAAENGSARYRGTYTVVQGRRTIRLPDSARPE